MTPKRRKKEPHICRINEFMQIVLDLTKKKLIPQRLWIYKKNWTLQKFSFSFFFHFLLLLFCNKRIFLCCIIENFFLCRYCYDFFSSLFIENFPHIHKKKFHALFTFFILNHSNYTTKDYKIRAWMKNLCKRFFPVIVLHISFLSSSWSKLHMKLTITLHKVY